MPSDVISGYPLLGPPGSATPGQRSRLLVRGELPMELAAGWACSATMTAATWDGPPPTATATLLTFSAVSTRPTPEVHRADCHTINGQPPPRPDMDRALHQDLLNLTGRARRVGDRPDRLTHPPLQHMPATSSSSQRAGSQPQGMTQAVMDPAATAIDGTETPALHAAEQCATGIRIVNLDLGRGCLPTHRACGREDAPVVLSPRSLRRR